VLCRRNSAFSGLTCFDQDEEEKQRRAILASTRLCRGKHYADAASAVVPDVYRFSRIFFPIKALKTFDSIL